MTAKEYLNQYRRAVERIREMELSIQRMEDKLDVQAIRYDKELIKGEAPEDRMAEVVSKICDIKIRRNVMKTQALLLCVEIEDVIARVKNPDYSRVLYDRYILGRGFDTIAEEMHTSSRQIFRWHGEALAAAEKVIKKTKSWQ